MSSKEKARELFPWDDEKEKRKPQRGAGIPPKTSLRAKIRSRPRGAGQEYLDMYLLAKEKDRLEKYGKSLGKSQEIAADSWRDMTKEQKRTISKLPEHAERKETRREKREVKKEEKTLPRNVKTVDWSY